MPSLRPWLAESDRRAAGETSASASSNARAADSEGSLLARLRPAASRQRTSQPHPVIADAHRGVCDRVEYVQFVARWTYGMDVIATWQHSVHGRTESTNGVR